MANSLFERCTLDDVSGIRFGRDGEPSEEPDAFSRVTAAVRHLKSRGRPDLAAALVRAYSRRKQNPPGVLEN